MRFMTCRPVRLLALALPLAAAPIAAQGQAPERDLFEDHPWTVSLMLGYIKFEGNEATKDSFFFPAVRVGYDFHSRLGIEAGLDIFPSLGARRFGDDRFALDGSIWAVRPSVDLIYHLRHTRDLRLDPYLSAGGGLMIYEEGVRNRGGQVAPQVAVGTGLWWHFNDWTALRADLRGIVSGTNTEFNTLATVGLTWRLGARPEQAFVVGGGMPVEYRPLPAIEPVDIDEDLSLITLQIEFDYDRDEIRPEYHQTLNEVLAYLADYPDALIRVEGHADRRPRSGRAYNQRLSERRAQSVVNYFVEQGGLARDRFEAVGYGFDRPVAPNDTEANMQRNRRAEIYIQKSGAQRPDPPYPLPAR